MRKQKLSFRGNIVTATRNPFLGQDESEKYPHADDDRIWLGQGLAILKDHILTVNEDGIIETILPARELSEKPEDSSIIQLGQHEFLCPGFIDLHIHAPQFAYTGTATDRPLMGPDGWLETYTFPAEKRLGDSPSLAKDVYERVVHTTLKSGTTTAVYFATLHVEPCKVLVDAALHHGQRALVGKVCMDRNSPSNYCHSMEQNVAETRELIEYIYGRAGKVSSGAKCLPRVLPLITPRFIPTCTPALMKELGKLAAEYDCHVTSHIAESIDEVAFSRHLDSTQDLKDGIGRTDAAIFDSHGLLTNKCIMAHGVHLSISDLDLMKERGAAVAHCPLSNFFFAGCSLECKKIMKRGNRIGLGTDVAGGYSPSMLHSCHMAVVASRALQHQRQQPESAPRGEDCVIDYRHAFYLATLGGAHALGLESHIGTLSVGKEFDAIVLSAQVARSPVHIFPNDTLEDVFQKLCVLGDDRNVRLVYVCGEPVVHDAE